MKDLKICAVIVTHNRKELLLRNIESLMKQTYPLDILIFDNASSDGTEEYLVAQGIIGKKNIHYHKSNINGGGSYGFCHGEQMATEKGYDYIWLMDDDGYCINEYVLDELLNAIDENDCKKIFNSYVICDVDTKEPTFPLGELYSYDEIKMNSKNGKVYNIANPYNGTLVPTQCFKEAGFTDERFFIYGDETEFLLRTKTFGYQWITVLSSLYFHPLNRKVIKELNVFGVRFDVLDQPIWKMYLDIRNTMYIKKQYYNKKISIKYILKLILICIYSKNKKMKRFRYGLLALNDGYRGKFDRPIMFGK